MATMIPVSQPLVFQTTQKYLTDVARSNWFSSHGPYVERFEKGFAHWLGVRHAATVTSGTAALHVALAAIDLQPGDEVIVPTFTMFSPVAALYYLRCEPIFIDSDPGTWTMKVEDVEQKITKKTKAILAVHIYGHPVDMDPLKFIAKKHKLFIIEDAAEGLGALYKGKKIGTLSDIACFSFYANKVVTTGEGGMVTTNNTKLFTKILALRDMYHDPKKRFLHTDIGFTYRMTNMQAAVGLSYLEHIDETIKMKQDIADTYNTYLSTQTSVSMQQKASWATPVWWMYGITVASDRISRDQLRKKLYAKGVDSRDFFVPAHMQPAVKKQSNKFRYRQFPIAENLSRDGLYLPSGPKITKKDIAAVCNALKNIYGSM